MCLLLFDIVNLYAGQHSSPSFEFVVGKETIRSVLDSVCISLISFEIRLFCLVI